MTDREIMRAIHRKTEKESDTAKDRDIEERLSYIQIHRKTEKESDTAKDRDRERDKESDTQKDRERERYS